MASEQDPTVSTDGAASGQVDIVANFPVGDVAAASLPPAIEAVVELDATAFALTADASGLSDY